MYGLIGLYGFLRSLFLPRQALLALVVVDFNQMFSQLLIKHNKSKYAGRYQTINTIMVICIFCISLFCDSDHIARLHQMTICTECSQKLNNNNNCLVTRYLLMLESKSVKLSGLT